MRIAIGKSAARAFFQSLADEKFEYFQEKILNFLDRLEKKEAHKVEKAFAAMDCLHKTVFPLNTTREWKGVKYVKIAPGKWRRKYDGKTRGAKHTVALIKRKALLCKTSIELLQLVLEHKSQFADANGYPIPFVRELSDYVTGLNEKIEAKLRKLSAGSGKRKRKGTPAKGGGKGFRFSSLGETEKARLAKQIRSRNVSEIGKDTVPYSGNERFAEAAREWIKQNPQGDADTRIGKVLITEKSALQDMHHGDNADKYLKLQTLPAVKDILEKGAYLGYEPDFGGKPIVNHYFAGKIQYGDEAKIVFCRVRENAGRDSRFYVHEVFTEDEIKKEASKRKTSPSSRRLTGKPLEASKRKTSPSSRRLTGKPLFAFILHDVLSVKEVRKAFFYQIGA